MANVSDTIRIAMQSTAGGDVASAEAALSRLPPAMAREPSTVHLWVALELRRGRPEEGLRRLNEAIAAAGSSHELMLSRGKLLGQMGRLDDALQSFSAALESNRQSALCWFLLAETARRLGKTEVARNGFSQARKCAPGDWRYWKAAADFELEAGEVEVAICLLKQFVASCGGSESLLHRLAEYQIRAGQLEAARSTYESMIKGGGSAEAYAGLGQLLEDLGAKTSAADAYRKSMALRPGWGLPCGAYLELLKDGVEEEVLSFAERTFRADETSDVDKALLGYGLGKVFEAQGRFDDAFGVRQLANDARRRHAGPYDLEGLRRRVYRTRDGFSSSVIGRLKAAGHTDARPVFIVGVPRSGTTLVEQVLAAHSDIKGLGELPDIPDISRALGKRLRSNTWPVNVGELDAEDIAQAAIRYRRAIELANDAKQHARVVDKTPANFFHVGLIECLFPNARIIWCRRDPRDIALSIFSENFALTQRYATSLVDVAHYISAQQTLMRHWQYASALPIIECWYEELVDDFESQARKLIDFVGLEFEHRCLSFHDSARTVQTPSRWQVRQPVFRGSVGRWERFKAYTSELESTLQTLGVELPPLLA